MSQNEEAVSEDVLFKWRIPRLKSSSQLSLTTMSPLKCLINLTNPSPTKTLLENPFSKPGGVKRKLELCSPRKRNKISKLATEESPKKLISIDSIKTAFGDHVYQHPYFAWLPLYPRNASIFNVGREDPLTFSKHPNIAEKMFKDWCESLTDLFNLLIEGKCPLFYVCSDNYNILFKKTSASIEPFSNGMGCELSKWNVEFNCPDSGSIEDDDEDEDEDEGDEIENEDASSILESLGISQQDFPSLHDSSSTKSKCQKQLATVEGKDNLVKLVKFLKSNRLYTVSNVGKFACIPPTLLSPREFRLGTLSRLA